MSSLDPNSPTATGSSFLPEPRARDASASNTDSFSPTNNKDEIEPQALLLLREFFLVLDQWDQQEEP